MRNQRPVMVDIDDADPADAINAFLHVLNKQRSLGLSPRTEHLLAEHLLRGDAQIVFYSSGGGGCIALAQDEQSLNDEDAFETVMFILERRKKRLQERRAREAEAASAIETGTAETEGLGPKAESAVAESETPNTSQDTNHAI